MRGLQIALGVLFALVALFAGGCSLTFTIAAILDWSNDLLGLSIIPALGYAVAFGTGWLAWHMFKGQPATGVPPGDVE